MGVQITSTEGRALYGLLAGTARDIVLTTDPQGFVIHASQAIEKLGLELPDLLFGPHLADIALPSHAGMIRDAFEAAISRCEVSGWIEFPGRSLEGTVTWFEIRLAPLDFCNGQMAGVIAAMRNIDERRLLEDELFAAAMTDPLTGLTNRQAFLAMLDHLAGDPAGGHLALFSIDHFKAINMRYGQRTGDKVLCAFADFLRAALRSDDTISRIGNRRFGALLPATDGPRAAALCERVLETLSRLGGRVGDAGLPISASVGLVAIGSSVETTINQAELSLFLARAKGPNRLEVEGGARGPRIPVQESPRALRQ
jgi:diguanylate cyclase (GGDEF)-like protein/PAS domain S-box-containing protein